MLYIFYEKVTVRYFFGLSEGEGEVSIRSLPAQNLIFRKPVFNLPIKQKNRD